MILLRYLRARLPITALLWLIFAACGTLLVVRPVWAGGGPENVLLVVNSADADSLTIANHFVQLRQIPTSNVMYLDWRGSDAKTDINTFRDKILVPVLNELDTRKLAPQIDYVVYSSSFPWAIDFLSDVPPPMRSDQQLQNNHEASITGLTYMMVSVVAKDMSAYVGVSAPGFNQFMTNRYMRLRENLGGQTWELSVAKNGIVMPRTGSSDGYEALSEPVSDSSVGSHGFRSWYGWGSKGELMEAGGSRYMLSTVLGVTYGRGNTLGEILRYLEASPKADGTAPTGTIYFMENSDIRSGTREPGFHMAVEQLKQLKVAAQIEKGDIPKNKTDVQGLLCGVAEFDWNSSRSTIKPGALCENLTSFSGIFTTNFPQTPLSVFLRNGATGSSGTVTEPFAIQNKFPHAMVQVHYARGCTLAEAFYQAVYAPYQLIVVGDPLCRPWANIPQIAVDGVKAGGTLKDKVSLHATATLPRGGSVDRFELFVDGERVASESAGEPLELDTRLYPDGNHELRVVGIENSAIESQGRAIIPVRFDNFGKTIRFEVSTDSDRPVRLGQKVQVVAEAPGARGVAVYHNKQMVAKFAGEKGEATFDSAVLGAGPVTLQAIGWGTAGGGVDSVVVSAPVSFKIESSGNGRGK